MVGRRFTNRGAAAGLALVLGGWLAGALAQGSSVPQTGPVDPDFAEIDQLARNYLTNRQQPGVSIVIAHADRIIYAQGYGWADRERAIPSSPWLEYRLASVSKTFTATAVMKLVEQGRLQLDGLAWDLIKDFVGAEPLDDRIKQITLRQLLTHSWGLDRAVTAEPNGRWITVNGQVLHQSRDLLRNYLLTKRLDFAPGARYAYNGLGFSWLQLITELQTGQPLGEQLTAMLGPEPLSTGRVRIGSTNRREVTLAEPVFHDQATAAQVAPMPGLYAAPAPASVPVPYGSFTLESYGGGGGLVASAFTVARFVQRLQGIRQPALLQPATYATMRSEQPLADGTRYTGLGVLVVPTYGTDHWISFNGSIPGTRTGWLSTPRSAGGARITIVALANGTPTGTDDLSADLVQPLVFAVDRIFAKAAAKPEIAGDRLIAWGSATHDFFADLLFDWGQRQFTALFPGQPTQAGTYEGYRFRYFGPTQTYLGAKDGRIWLYQPAASPQIGNIAAMADFLPQATRDTFGLK